MKKYNLRRLREDRMETLAMTSERTGVPVSTLSAYERGLTVSADHAARLEQHYGLPEGALWSRPQICPQQPFTDP